LLRIMTAFLLPLSQGFASQGLTTYKDFWCVSGLNTIIEGTTSAEECYAACAKEYPGRPNFAEFSDNCYCQDSCECTSTGADGVTITSKPFNKMPPNCCDINRENAVYKCNDGAPAYMYGCKAETIEEFVNLMRTPMKELDCIGEASDTWNRPAFSCDDDFVYVGEDEVDYNALKDDDPIVQTLAHLDVVLDKDALTKVKCDADKLKKCDPIYVYEVCADDSYTGGRNLMIYTSKEDCKNGGLPVAVNTFATMPRQIPDWLCGTPPEEESRRKLSKGSSKTMGPIDLDSDAARKHIAAHRKWRSDHGKRK